MDLAFKCESNKELIDLLKEKGAHPKKESVDNNPLANSDNPLACLESDDFRNEIERAKRARDQASRNQWANQGSPGAGQKHQCCMCSCETFGEETVLTMQRQALMQNNPFLAQIIEKQSAYRCKNCGKEYCKDCLEKKAPGNAYGGKSCPGCYGLFEIVHG